MEKNAMEDEALFYNGIEHILQESTWLHRMVIQLLEMQENKRYLETERIDARKLLRNVADSMQMKAERYKNKLVVEECRDACYINGREYRIRQVLINLIDNAIKYGETEEEIRLQMKVQENSLRISVINSC